MNKLVRFRLQTAKQKPGRKSQARLGPTGSAAAANGEMGKIHYGNSWLAWLSWKSGTNERINTSFLHILPIEIETEDETGNEPSESQRPNRVRGESVRLAEHGG